jgi:hypothetical protein
MLTRDCAPPSVSSAATSDIVDVDSDVDSEDIEDLAANMHHRNLVATAKYDSRFRKFLPKSETELNAQIQRENARRSGFLDSRLREVETDSEEEETPEKPTIANDPPCDAPEVVQYKVTDGATAAVTTIDCPVLPPKPPKVNDGCEVSRSVTFSDDNFHVATNSFPSAFIGGHCYMKAFWTNYWPLQSKIKQRDLIRIVHRIGHKHLPCKHCTPAMVDNYCFLGVWDVQFLECLPVLLTEHFGCTIRIANTANGATIQYGNIGKEVAIDWNGHNHFNARGGSALNKFAELLNQIEIIDKDVFEISAAPGLLAQLAATCSNYTFGHYTPGVALHPTLKADLKKRTIILADKICHYFPYTNI